VLAWLCSAASGWSTGRVLRIDGNTVHPVESWSVRPGYTAVRGGRSATAEPDPGMRTVMGITPPGLAGLRVS
jgi:hypothetical protein